MNDVTNDYGKARCDDCGRWGIAARMVRLTMRGPNAVTSVYAHDPYGDCLREHGSA